MNTILQCQGDITIRIDKDGVRHVYCVKAKPKPKKRSVVEMLLGFVKETRP